MSRSVSSPIKVVEWTSADSTAAPNVSISWCIYHFAVLFLQFGTYKVDQLLLVTIPCKNIVFFLRKLSSELDHGMDLVLLVSLLGVIFNGWPVIMPIKTTVAGP